MLQNLAIALEAVTPTFLLIFFGYVLKLTGLFDEQMVKKMNRMLFYTLFPCIVFSNLYGASVEEAFEPKLFLCTISVSLVTWLASVPFVMLVEKKNCVRGAMVQAMNRTNFLVIGFQIIENIFEGADLSSAAVITAGVLMLNSLVPVIVFESFRGGRPGAGRLLKGVITNPILIATLAGAVVMLLGPDFPQTIDKTINSLKDTGTYFALIIIGASLDFSSIGERKKNLIICVCGKLIAAPAAAALLGGLMGFRGISFITMFAFFSGPTTSTSYAMAEQMESDSQLSRDCIVISSALAPFSIFCWIFIFKTLNLF